MDEADPLGGDVPAQEERADLAERVGGVIRVFTDWSTSDPGLAHTLTLIQQMPRHSPERHEAEAFLHMTLARAAWREADRLRTAEQRRRTPRVAGPDDGRRQVRKGACTMCQALVRLRVDGTVRVHDVGSGAAQSRSIAGAANRCVGAGLPPSSP